MNFTCKMEMRREIRTKQYKTREILTLFLQLCYPVENTKFRSSDGNCVFLTEYIVMIKTDLVFLFFENGCVSSSISFFLNERTPINEQVYFSFYHPAGDEYSFSERFSGLFEGKTSLWKFRKYSVQQKFFKRSQMYFDEFILNCL